MLLLNDDEELLLLMEVLLEGSGFHPIITSDEAHALELLRRGSIDVFIQDLLRGSDSMGGWRLFELIHENAATRDIPSICMTGAVRQMDFADRLAELGVDGYAGLPIDARHFPNYVRAVIDGREPRSPQEPPKPGAGRAWRADEHGIQDHLHRASRERRGGG